MYRTSPISIAFLSRILCNFCLIPSVSLCDPNKTVKHVINYTEPKVISLIWTPTRLSHYLILEVYVLTRQSSDQLKTNIDLNN